MSLRISILLAIMMACTLSQDCPPLPLLDQANIRFFYNKTYPNNGPSNLIVNYTLDPCFDCLTQFATNVSSTAINSTYFLFSTQWMGSFYIYNESEWALPNHNVPKPFLQAYYEIQQGGNYTFTITDIYATGSNEWQGLNLEYSVDVAGDDIWIPLYISILIGIGLALLYNLVIYLYYIRENYKKNKLTASSGNLDESRDGLLLNKLDESKSESVAKLVAPKGKDMSQRVKSLDTFRGITLSIMIFANAGGGAYVLLDHSPWNGLQLADLLFPWFIWMMGFSMAISYESQRKKGFSKRNMMEKVLMRTFKLAFLGLMSSNFGKPFNDLRIPGVLMRFGVSYFFISLIIIFVPRKEVSDSSDDKYKVLVQHTYEYIVVLLIIITWLSITFGLSVPGCPTGYIGPGGLLGSYGLYPNCTGGAAGYIDKTILGISHMYDEPTCQPIYLTGPYDPEGILGCLNNDGFLWTHSRQSPRLSQNS
jgi:heparan-alpha-glucosaminide N-acetyltransferase